MRSFIDTNVLVYADDVAGTRKQEIARRLVASHLKAASGVVSTQVLQEYVNVALRKLRLPVDLVRSRLSTYRRLETVPATADLIASALDIHQLHRLSFWDALIVQAARQSGCVQLLSEDMNSGAILAGVRLVNPFA